MLVTIGIYTMIFGWKFALGFVILIYIHENGHLLAAKIKGLQTGKPVFIPFVGALIRLKEQPKDASTEAFIAVGGPLVGGLASVLCFLVYTLNHSELWLSLAYIGLFLNTFNLVPVHPLDGGRIVTVISNKIWIVGLVALAYLTYRFESPLMLLILILGAVQAWKSYRNPNPAYYQAPLRERALYTLLYFSMLIGFGTLMMHSYGLLPTHTLI